MNIAPDTCPFCGSEDTNIASTSLMGCWVYCVSCGAGGPRRENEPGAIGAWNQVYHHYYHHQEDKMKNLIRSLARLLILVNISSIDDLPDWAQVLVNGNWQLEDELIDTAISFLEAENGYEDN